MPGSSHAPPGMEAATYDAHKRAHHGATVASGHQLAGLPALNEASYRARSAVRRLRRAGVTALCPPCDIELTLDRLPDERAEQATRMADVELPSAVRLPVRTHLPPSAAARALLAPESERALIRNGQAERSADGWWGSRPAACPRRMARRGRSGERVMSASDLIPKLRQARENSRAATPIEGARRAADLAQDIASDALDPEDLAPAVYALSGALLDLCDAIEHALAAESAR